MRWLFLRLFVFVLLASIPAILAIEIYLKWPYDYLDLPYEEEIDDFERALAGGCKMAVERLENAPQGERERVRKELETLFGYPIILFPGDGNIPELAKERFDAGSEVANYWDAKERDYIMARFRDGSTYVRFGPYWVPKEVTIGDRLYAYGPGVLILGIGIWLLIWPLALQLKRLEKAAQEISQCQWGSRIRYKRLPEVKNVARAFNRMAEKTESVVAGQRMLLRSVAHELRNPLARLRFGIEEFEDLDNRKERSESIENLDRDIEQLTRLIDELLNYSKLEEDDAAIETEPVVISALIDEIAKKEKEVSEAHVCVAFGKMLSKLTEPLLIDNQSFSDALANLIRNGLDHAAGNVRVDAELEGDRLRVTVEDDGPGIPPADQARVFLPFVRLEENKGKGFGLGLAIVRRTIERNGGSIRLGPSRLGGCLFDMVWIVEKA
ncbi:MAG: hypothetical protein GY854_09600 [Deltaproteobacteria bacterium]|nr:hypothetical protein [Deltaproteobacteria bacterium]